MEVQPRSNTERDDSSVVDYVRLRSVVFGHVPFVSPDIVPPALPVLGICSRRSGPVAAVVGGVLGLWVQS